MVLHDLLTLTHPCKNEAGAPLLRPLQSRTGFGDPQGLVSRVKGPWAMVMGVSLTHRHEGTLVLSLSTVTAQETKSKDQSTSCDEEVAHVDKLHGAGRQRPEDLQEG